jgi:hypothetical protein
MTEITIHVDGLADALDLGFSIRDWYEDNAAIISDEHPSSSYGLPVLVKDGKAYGPSDLPGVRLILGNTDLTGAQFIESAEAAGWSVRINDVTR